MDAGDEPPLLIKKRGKRGLRWKSSEGYQKTRQRIASRGRKLAAHRKSLRGRKVHEIVAVGNTIILEKVSSSGEGSWKRGRNARTPRF